MVEASLAGRLFLFPGDIASVVARSVAHQVFAVHTDSTSRVGQPAHSDANPVVDSFRLCGFN